MPGKRWSTVVGLVSVAVYALLWFGWTQGWTWLVRTDTTALDAAYRLGSAHRGWATFWDWFCNVFSPVTFRVVTLGLIAYELTRRRDVRTALFLFLSIEVSGVVTEVAKRLVDRPRPVTAMVDAPSSSFPSGHALGSMVALLALAVVYLPRIQRHRWPWLMAVGVLVVVLVGVGRVALNVHHPSDVVAGWALGYLYFLACLPVLRRGVRAGDERPVTPDTGRGS